MKIIKKIKRLALLTSPLMLAGCFSGDGSSSGGVQVQESQLAIDTSTAPKGPAAYAIHQNLENDQDLQNQLNSIIKEQNKLNASKQSFIGISNNSTSGTDSDFLS